MKLCKLTEEGGRTMDHPKTADEGTMKRFRSRRWGLVEIQEAQYFEPADRIAIQLRAGGEPLAILTINLPDEPLNPSEMFVKTWSENAEIAAEALESGLFVDTGKRVPTGFVEAQIWKFA